MAMPHWHAQVEVNYVMRGTVHYRMSDHEFRLNAGEMCLFWGGQPHQMDESSDDSLYAGAHLPLVYFFRLRLPISVSSRLMKGETLLTSATDAADSENFTRWFRYANSGDPAKAQHAVDELLLRIERIALEPYSMTSQATINLDGDHPYPHSSRSVARMVRYHPQGPDHPHRG